MKHLKILTSFVSTLSLPDIIACDKISQAILLVFAYCKWQELESMRALEQRYAQHEQWSEVWVEVWK